MKNLVTTMIVFSFLFCVFLSPAAFGAGAASVYVTAAGSVTDAVSAVNTTYTFKAGNYTYSIAGFGPGDKLVFPAGQTPTVINNDFTDGAVDVQWASGGNIIVVHLTGLTNTQDGAIYSISGLNKVFGAGSVQ